MTYNIQQAKDRMLKFNESVERIMPKISYSNVANILSFQWELISIFSPWSKRKGLKIIKNYLLRLAYNQ